jgi:hypothetical protein
MTLWLAYRFSKIYFCIAFFHAEPWGGGIKGQLTL